MHFGNLHFKNMDEEYKDTIIEKTAHIFDHLKKDYLVTGTFERASSGIFSGTIHCKAEDEEFHAHAENDNINLMVTGLKKKLRAQIDANKNHRKSQRHDKIKGDGPVDVGATHRSLMAQLDALAVDMHNKPVPKVLIIDDDIEAIVPMEMIFREMGCVTSFAIERQEAINKLRHIPCDIIVLDWMLDNTTGGELIRNISLEGEAFTIEHGYKPKVITYSGLEDRQISFPKNQWFEHVKHWTKPINYDQISVEAKSLMKAMGF